MASDAFNRWVKAGRPYRDAVPNADLAHNVARHGYTVFTKGNDEHMEAPTPEDHTAFSATGWPKPSAFGVGHANDIMPPTKPGLPSLAQLGAQIVKDKNAGYPGTEAIKYINWTTADGDVVQDSWTPTHERNDSDDEGHIHLSVRSDMDTRHTDYDPVARVLGDDDMNPAQDKNLKATVAQVTALTKMETEIVTSWSEVKPKGREPVPLVVAVNDIKAALTTLLANQAALAGKDFVDEQSVVDGVLAGLGGLDPAAAAVALKAVLRPEQVVALAAALTAA